MKNDDEQFNKFIQLVKLIKISQNKINNNYKINNLKFKILNLNVAKKLYQELLILINQNII